MNKGYIVYTNEVCDWQNEAFDDDVGSSVCYMHRGAVCAQVRRDLGVTQVFMKWATRQGDEVLCAFTHPPKVGVDFEFVSDFEMTKENFALIRMMAEHSVKLREAYAERVTQAVKDVKV